MCPAQPRAVADARHRHLHIARQIARHSDSAGSGVGVAPLPDHPGNKFFENLARAIQLCGGSNYGTISGRAPEGGICSWHLFAYSTDRRCRSSFIDSLTMGWKSELGTSPERRYGIALLTCPEKQESSFTPRWFPTGRCGHIRSSGPSRESSINLLKGRIAMPLIPPANYAGWFCAPTKLLSNLGVLSRAA